VAATLSDDCPVKPRTNINRSRRWLVTSGAPTPGLEVALRDAGLTKTGLRDAVATVERQLIALALMEAQGNITHAARRLRITRPTLYSLIKKHKLSTGMLPTPEP
jgi:DNA-binding NtrC family response regulator